MNENELFELVGSKNIIKVEGKSKFGKSFWIRIQTNNNSVEGTIHLPNSTASKIVLFEPGFPGGGSTQFEELWLDTILKNNFAVFLARHGGTIIDGKYASNYIWSDRLNNTFGSDLNILGTKSNPTLSDWIFEPKIALEVLGSKFEEVVLCGHSFGPLAILDSVIDCAKENPTLLNNVSRIVSLSGSTGIIRSDNDEILKIWFDHLDTEWARERVAIGDAKMNTELFKQSHIKVNKFAKAIPKHIEFLAVVAWGDKKSNIDEIVHPMDSIDFINSLGRGYLIVDKKEYGKEDKSRMAHDMESLTGDDLLKFVSADWHPESQISILE